MGENSNTSNFVSALQTFEKLVMLAIIVFIIYEMYQYKGSAIGKALDKSFGAVAGFSAWLASHPSLIVAAVFSYIFVPLASVLAGVVGNIVKARISRTKEMRSKEPEARKAVKEYIEENNPELSEDEVSKRVDDAIRVGAEKSYAEQAKAQADAGEVSGEPISAAQAEDLNDIFYGFQEAFDALPDDEQNDAVEAEENMF